MVDHSGEYVLQWEGHAGHVTERFSSLFARQSLVDVTLICEEQRLRVHRLVLASCSLYFEEMLEQDLGQEPTILLSDLNFQVLKAMVEFMYCGETCVAKEHLEPLLHAARVFKVKELACIAENMMGPTAVQDEQVRNCTEFAVEDTDDLEDVNEYSLFSDNNSLETLRWRKIGVDEYSGNDSEEGSDRNVESLKDFSGFKVPLSLAELACRKVVKFYNEIPSVAEIYMKKMNRDKESIEDVNGFGKNNEKLFEPVLYEQCCDIVNTEKDLNECIIDNIETPEFCQEQKPSLEFKEVTRTVDKCLKVYTHKRRRSVEGVEKQYVKSIKDLPEPEMSNNCIDLIEEPSKNETELEKNYILNLNNESFDNLVDFACEETVYSTNKKSLSVNKQPSRQMKEIFSNHNRMISSSENSDTTIYKSNSLCAPALRRSVRLNHQENEDSTNNNNNNSSIQVLNPKAKDLRRESFRRKNKGSDLYCESDENEVSKNSIRSLRSNSSKLIERRSGKDRLSLSKNSDEEEENLRINGRSSNSDMCESFTNKFNTIATVSRALWGDMSDCLENNENNIDFGDYSPSKEIPFAVGLLPLRAALERMQAMPDYQPRKTRSSVTPFRHEFKGVKRKNPSNNVVDQNNYKLKRQNSNSNGNNNINHNNNNNLPRNTVCHVRITTSHSEPVRQRRRLINEQVEVAAATISPTNIVNRQ